MPRTLSTNVLSGVAVIVAANDAQAARALASVLGELSFDAYVSRD
jgi:hypothetical protein